MTCWPCRVVVVDDDPDILDLVELVLNMESCQVLRAHNGQEALHWLAQPQCAQAEGPCLVLLDLMLPDMRGEEVFQKMQALPGGRVPVIVMSAAADATVRAARMRVPLLSKPFDVEDLMAAVQRACEQHQTHHRPGP